VPPKVYIYEVVATSDNSGYIQHVPGKTFHELNQNVITTAEEGANKGTPLTNTILDKHDSSTAGTGNVYEEVDVSNDATNPSSTNRVGWDEVNLVRLAPSLVGGYVTNFILGTRDRHEHNMMVVGDFDIDPQLMQIDFGYILMEYPGGVRFDTPRLTMPVSLIDRLNQTPGLDGESSLMDDVQHDMLAAYLVLRKHSKELIEFCKVAFCAIKNPKSVESFLRGKHSLRADDTERDAIRWFSQKLESQLSRFVFRREVRRGMVASYYAFHRGLHFSRNLRSNTRRRLLLNKAARAMSPPFFGGGRTKRRSRLRRSHSTGNLVEGIEPIQCLKDNVDDTTEGSDEASDG
jgi:hypothetical protein